MSKKYFVKHLPVEDEIKDKDTVWNPRRKIYQQVEIENEEDSRVYNSHIGEKKAYEKVKLFLCSRDIQVGDKCLTNDGEGSEVEIIEGGIIYSGKVIKCPPTPSAIGFVQQFHLEELFKVIGEISPDALAYVKEGQEFDEDEVKFMIHKYIPWGEDWDEELTEKEYTKIGESGKHKRDSYSGKSIQIKGPCGHFH